MARKAVGMVRKQDPTIQRYFLQVENEMPKGTGFYIKDDILMRQYRPRDVSPNDDCAVVHQIVLPRSCRSQVL